MLGMVSRFARRINYSLFIIHYSFKKTKGLTAAFILKINSAIL